MIKLQSAMDKKKGIREVWSVQVKEWQREMEV